MVRTSSGTLPGCQISLAGLNIWLEGAKQPDKIVIGSTLGGPTCARSTNIRKVLQALKTM